VVGIAGATFPDHRLNPRSGKELRYVFDPEVLPAAKAREPLIDCQQKTYFLVFSSESAATVAPGSSPYPSIINAWQTTRALRGIERLLCAL
jgi:hypothetical protein